MQMKEKKAYQRAYYLKNIERLKIYKNKQNKIYRLSDLYRLKHPLKSIFKWKGLSSKEYYKKNWERFRLSRIKYYLKHKELCLKRWKKYRKKYCQTKNGKAAISRAVKKYEKIHPERKIAWIKAQKIHRSPCIICGDINTHRHHPDPLKPLEVIMLCPLHHKKEHLQIKNSV